MSTTPSRVRDLGLLMLIVALFAGLTWAINTDLRASENPVYSTRILNAAVAAESKGTISSSIMAQCRESAIYVDWTAGTTSGVVTVETANDANYTGTWAPLSVVTFSATAPKQDVVQVTGVAMAIRARVSTVVAVGTVNAWFICN